MFYFEPATYVTYGGHLALTIIPPSLEATY